MRRDCLLLLVFGATAWALFSGPVTAQPAAERYRVVGVSAEDVLNIRTGPSARYPVAGAMPHDARGIRGLGSCVQGWCHIRYGSVMGWSSARFLAADSGAPDAAEPMPGAGEPGDTAATHRVLEDGTLEIRLTDGTVRRRLPNGQTMMVRPDGTTMFPRFIHVPIADLPPLPPALDGWGSRLGDELLSILGNILTSAEMEAYRQTEAGKGYYQLVDWRLRSIEFLTAPGS